MLRDWLHKFKGDLKDETKRIKNRLKEELEDNDVEKALDDGKIALN